MKVVALDTTARACSVAVSADGRMFRQTKEMEVGQAEALVPMLQATMADAALRYEELDLIAVTIGPGAFTGVRIGLATARALAVATSRPCLGVTTLEVLAEQVDDDILHGRPLLTAIDTKRHDLYVQAFACDRLPLMPPRVAAPSELVELIERNAEPVLIVGDGTELAGAALRDAGRAWEAAPGPRYPDVAVLAAIAERRWLAGVRPVGRPSPLYLRPADTGPVRAPR
jgi:tRNA threonylcarbamoyladenosine biosynthesis protein TsaB